MTQTAQTGSHSGYASFKPTWSLPDRRMCNWCTAVLFGRTHIALIKMGRNTHIQTEPYTKRPTMNLTSVWPK